VIGYYQTPLGICFHSERLCKGNGNCAVHRPSKDNRMREWPFVVRLDKGGLLERTCAHGVGHPDSDSLEWLRQYEDEETVSALGIHGCDGCCVSNV
jgi:hypothetical protein